MTIRYSEWAGDAMSREERLQQLFRLFSYLLTKTSGDVDEALEWLSRIDEQYGILGDMTMQQFIDELKRAGLIREAGDNEENSFDLTARGAQRIRQDALSEIFTSLKKSGSGGHETPYTGSGVERTGDLREYEFGDQSSNIDATSTLSNALRRESNLERFSLEENDIRVHETEHTTNVATVLMLDISHSMILYGEDRITPAKQVALALAELITTRYPKDRLHVLLFGDEAREVNMHELPFVSVGPFHTNTRAGLQLARQLLKRKGSANKQIFMITDGKPSAMFEPSGRLYKNSFGLDPRIVNKTLDEAVACRRDGITITTFMVTDDPYLVNFVEDLTRANQGRAYFSGLSNLGETVFVDYIRNRRKKFAGGRRQA
ncbi:MAG TPA: VWA domain-containing protein [Candidatus Kapabacteria bacterium]|nr:VWA domain-containing protein [Candidatus Kapabacteria bacterium]